MNAKERQTTWSICHVTCASRTGAREALASPMEVSTYESSVTRPPCVIAWKIVSPTLSASSVMRLALRGSLQPSSSVPTSRGAVRAGPSTASNVWLSWQWLWIRRSLLSIAGHPVRAWVGVALVGLGHCLNIGLSSSSCSPCCMARIRTAGRRPRSIRAWAGRTRRHCPCF